jgi:S-formylglutathione hydrolase FrmB
MKAILRLIAGAAILACPANMLGQFRPMAPVTESADVTVRDAQFQSESLGRPMKYRIILPADYDRESRRYPVLYLLHGLGGDYRDWETKTRIDEYARRYRLIIVMPDAGNSWYTNSAGNPHNKYEDYIAKDLVREVDDRYRTLNLRTARFIGGLSMGGYGAMKFGLKYPQMFSFAASFSGAFSMVRTGLDPKGRWPKGAIEEFTEILGAEGSETRTASDIATVIAKADPKVAPFLYFDCGIDDNLVSSNREVGAQLQKAGFRFEYRERPGRHEWIYWDHQMREMLRVLAENADIGGARD